MEKIEYPNIGSGKTVEQQLNALRGFLNEMVDVLNYNFEQIENQINKEEE